MKMHSVWLIGIKLSISLLVIENKSSKQGYQINKIIKYGDIKLFS